MCVLLCKTEHVAARSHFKVNFSYLRWTGMTEAMMLSPLALTLYYFVPGIKC